MHVSKESAVSVVIDLVPDISIGLCAIPSKAAPTACVFFRGVEIDFLICLPYLRHVHTLPTEAFLFW